MAHRRLILVVFSLMALLVFGASLASADLTIGDVTDAVFEGCVLRVNVYSDFGGDFDLRIAGSTGMLTEVSFNIIEPGGTQLEIELPFEPEMAPIYALLYTWGGDDLGEISLGGKTVYEVPDCNGDDDGEDPGDEGEDPGDDDGDGGEVPTEDAADEATVEITWFEAGDNRINRQPYAPFAVVCSLSNAQIVIYGLDAEGDGYPIIAYPLEDVSSEAPAENVLLAANEGVALYHLSSGDLMAVGAPAADGKQYAFAWNGCPVSQSQAYTVENGQLIPTEYNEY